MNKVKETILRATLIMDLTKLVDALKANKI
jgi:hypothetical protein